MIACITIFSLLQGNTVPVLLARFWLILPPRHRMIYFFHCDHLWLVSLWLGPCLGTLSINTLFFPLSPYYSERGACIETNVIGTIPPRSEFVLLILSPFPFQTFHCMARKEIEWMTLHCDIWVFRSFQLFNRCMLSKRYFKIYRSFSCFPYFVRASFPVPCITFQPSFLPLLIVFPAPKVLHFFACRLPPPSLVPHFVLFLSPSVSNIPFFLSFFLPACIFEGVLHCAKGGSITNGLTFSSTAKVRFSLFLSLLWFFWQYSLTQRKYDGIKPLSFTHGTVVQAFVSYGNIGRRENAAGQSYSHKLFYSP